MARARKSKLTPYLRRQLKRLQGARLCRERRGPESGTTFFVEPGGEPFPPSAALKLIALRKVVPADDGLFDGEAQTFKARDRS